jgi:hypothetical protein
MIGFHSERNSKKDIIHRTEGQTDIHFKPKVKKHSRKKNLSYIVTKNVRDYQTISMSTYLHIKNMNIANVNKYFVALSLGEEVNHFFVCKHTLCTMQ